MNWKIRMQNGRFLMGLVGLLGLVSVYVAGQLGYTFDYEPIQTMLAMLLSLLAGVGIISDPTTPGISDSLITMQKTNINQTSQDVINLQNLSKILATTAPSSAPVIAPATTPVPVPATTPIPAPETVTAPVPENEVIK